MGVFSSTVHIHLTVNPAIITEDLVGYPTDKVTKKAQHRVIIAEKLYQEQELKVKEICEQLLMSRGTFYNYLRHRGVKIGGKQ